MDGYSGKPLYLAITPLLFGTGAFFVCGMLINNTMKFIDKKFMIVSRLMGDSRLKGFVSTVLTPLASTLAVAFIRSFTLSFTDYGIPAALAGNVDLLSTRLYNEMLGSLPNFHTGSAVSVLMLLPSVLSIILITVLNKYNIRYAPTSIADLADPQYEGYISVVDIQGSSTAWLMIQALVSEYGEGGAKEVLTGIYKNAGAPVRG